MRLTTKGRYAVTAMIDLAMNQSVGPVSLKSISDNQGISLSYLEQLFAKMKRCDLVVGARGPGGGYTLARDVDSISIAECEGEENCHDGKRCLAHDLWSELTTQLHDFLSDIHLGELMRRSGIDRAPDGSPTARIARRNGQRVSLPK